MMLVEKNRTESDPAGQQSTDDVGPQKLLLEYSWKIHLSFSRPTKGQTLLAERRVFPNSIQVYCCQADKYDTGSSYAVFNELGSSASEVTAAKFCWRLLQANLNAQDKQALQCHPTPKLRRSAVARTSQVRISYHIKSGQSGLQSIRGLVNPLVRNWYGHTLLGIIW